MGFGSLQLWLVEPSVVERASEWPWAVAGDEVECRRFEALATPALRRAFLGRRAVLRRLLAAYTGRQPGQLDLVRQWAGKPELAEGQGPHFSLSSSAGWVLAAFSWDQPVGVDLERLRDDVGVEAIVRRHFSAEEQRSLGAQDAAERLKSFFQVWTRKEAVLKLYGVGLDGLDALQKGPSEMTRAWIEDLRLPGSFSAAVALPRPPLSLELRCWDGKSDPPGLAWRPREPVTAGAKA